MQLANDSKRQKKGTIMYVIVRTTSAAAEEDPA
jgi:hypothetical protein